MNYKRLSSLLVASLVVLLVISFIMICTWFYYFFRTDRTGQADTTTKKTAPLDHGRRDSLTRVYTATMNDLNTPLDSVWNRPDSLALLDTKLVEFNRLRNEIARLLQNTTNNNDLDSARLKIAALQQKIEDLRNRTMLVEYENKRLNEIVRQLSNRLVRSGEKARHDAAAHSVTERINVSSNASALSVLPAVSDLRLTALSAGDGKDQETNDASRAEKLSGSFLLNDPDNNTSVMEMMVVITGPDGKVLRGSDWESGSFETREGKKIYSCKVKWEKGRTDNRRMYFSLPVDELQEGNYSLQVFYNGMLIGKNSRSF